MKNPFQKVTHTSIVTVSIIGSLAVIAVIANQVSGRTQNAAVTDTNSSDLDTTKTVTGAADSAAEVTIAQSESSSSTTDTDQAESADTPTNGSAVAEENKTVVTSPAPGVTKVEGENFSLTVERNVTTNEPDATPSDDPNDSSINVGLEEGTKTRWRLRSSKSEDSETSSSTRTRIRTTQDGDTTTIRYNSN